MVTNEGNGIVNAFKIIGGHFDLEKLKRLCICG